MSSVTKRRDPDFQPAKRIQDKYAIARGTLRNWANSGRIGVL
jgi:hypothetical protein